MRELTCHEIALVSGADGEEIVEAAVEVCSALGDAAAVTTAAAVIAYSGLPSPQAVGIGSLAGNTANELTTEGCTSFIDALYTWVSSSAQLIIDNTMAPPTATEWF